MVHSMQDAAGSLLQDIDKHLFDGYQTHAALLGNKMISPKLPITSTVLIYDKDASIQ